MTPPPVAPLKRSQRIAVVLAPKIIRLLAWTWRLRIENFGVWSGRRSKGLPSIVSLWHGQMLPLLFNHRGQGVNILISEHRDGELITQVAKRLGLDAIRGSTTRGAARALLSMSRVLEEGKEIAVTPDGPRGPSRTVAPGILVVSQRANVPIIPIGVAASKAWHLRSWDSFMIPKPFSRVAIVYGEAMSVQADNARDAATHTEELQVAMAAAVDRAQAIISGAPVKSSTNKFATNPSSTGK